MRPGFLVSTLCWTSLIVGGCSAKETRIQVDSGTSSFEYSINFQSQRNAIGSRFVRVRVFDAAKVGADVSQRQAYCNELISRAKTGQDFPADTYTILGETPDVSPCEILDATKAVGRLNVSYGVRAVLVVARNPDTLANGRDDILAGCGIGEVKETGSDAIVVPLNPVAASREAPPQGSCARLTDRCAGAAGCPPP